MEFYQNYRTISQARQQNSQLKKRKRQSTTKKSFALLQTYYSLISHVHPTHSAW